MEFSYDISSVIESIVKNTQSLVIKLNNAINTIELENTPEDIKRQIEENSQAINIIKRKKIYFDKRNESLENHLNELRIWCKEVRLRAFNGSSRDLKKSYIELDTYLNPVSSQISLLERKNKEKLINAINSTQMHCVILGGSGAGKTTSMKNLCLSVLENSGPTKYSFVVRILLRNLTHDTSKTPIKDTLKDLIGFHFERDESFEKGMSEVALGKAYAAFLDSLQCLVIIDGFDEIVKHETKDYVFREFKFYCSQMSKTKLILTSRTGEIKSDIPNAIFYEISKLDNHQIVEFAKKNLGENAEGFLKSIEKSPYFDTAVRPLLLAQLAAIYEKHGFIPEKPKRIYQMILELLIIDWDIQNSVIRLSNFSDFEKYNKEEFLSNLAFRLTCDGIRGEFNFTVFENICAQLSETFSFPNDKNSILKIADELESHTGILFKCRVNNYEFSHRSIQEYLTALYISKLPSSKSLLEVIGEHKKILYLGSELAMATAISSAPKVYFSELFLELPKSIKLDRVFIDQYIERLIDECVVFSGNSKTFSLAVFVVLNHGITHTNVCEEFYKFIDHIFEYKEIALIGEHYELDEQYTGKNLRLKLYNSHPIYDLPLSLNISYKKEQVRAVISNESKNRKIKSIELYNRVN